MSEKMEEFIVILIILIVAGSFAVGFFKMLSNQAEERQTQRLENYKNCKIKVINTEKTQGEIISDVEWCFKRFSPPVNN